MLVLIEDIKSYGALGLAYETDVMPRVKELGVIMGNYKQIPIYETVEEHSIVSDIDVDGDGFEQKVGPDYCWRCGDYFSYGMSLECRRRIGKR